MSDEPAELRDPSDRSGRSLADKYTLLRRLGRGGMGEVYEALHSVVGRRFAVKFLLPELAREADMMNRFKREAKAAGSLESEHIAAVVDFGHAEDGAPYIVMEFLQGEDLRLLLVREGRLSVERAVDLVIQACSGLHAAHGQGIIHRDLKPENLFVVKRADRTELVKVLDFGIAKLRGQPTSGVSTKAGAVMGTLLYMPPEQVRGEKDADHRADVYALGAILYEALTGNVPHPGDAVQSIMYHILYEPPAPLATLRRDLPPGLEAVVMKALAFDAAARYQSVAALADALAPFAGRRVTPLQTHSSVALAATAASADSEVMSAPAALHSQQSLATQRALEAAGLSRPRFAGRRSLAALIALAVVTGGLVLWALAGSEPREPTHLVQPAPLPAAPAPEVAPREPAPAVAPAAAVEQPVAVLAPSAADTLRPLGRPERPSTKSAQARPRSAPRTEAQAAATPAAAPNPATAQPHSKPEAAPVIEGRLGERKLLFKTDNPLR